MKESNIKVHSHRKGAESAKQIYFSYDNFAYFAVLLNYSAICNPKCGLSFPGSLGGNGDIRMPVGVCPQSLLGDERVNQVRPAVPGDFYCPFHGIPDF